MGKNNAKMINEELWIQAGINRRTGLPLKMTAYSDDAILSGSRILLRIKDEQQAVNRYKWTLPKELKITSEELERFLYYKGQLCFFMMKYKDIPSYYITPFALDGTIDVYGRFNAVKPVPFAAGMDYKNKEANESLANISLMLSLKHLRVIRSETDIVEESDRENVCVLLNDYSKQLAETIIPRQQLQEPILEMQSLNIAYLKTNMLASVGVKGVRVGDQDQYSQIIEMSKSLDNFARAGKIYYPILGSIEAQELTEKNMAGMNDYMQTFQSLDNLRLSFYGLENGGVFEKKAHTLDKEEEVNATNTDLVYDDGLSLRQSFCELVKHAFGVEISVRDNKQQLKDNIAVDGNDKIDKGGNKDGTGSTIQ